MPDASKPLIQLDVYQGPLDLLLSLIEQQRLDITAISLAQVADQYLQAVARLDAPDPDALAEFLVIGAKLLVIKTRALLPRPPAELAPHEEEDVGDQLARQLAAYKCFKEAAAWLRQHEGRRSHTRLAAPPLPPPAPLPPLQVGLAELLAAVQRRLQLLLPLEPEPVSLPAPKIITIAEVRARLVAALQRRAWISFEDLLGLTITRNEVIVTLWTVLELFKRQAIVLEQEQRFGPIGIGRGPAFDAAAHAPLPED